MSPQKNFIYGLSHQAINVKSFEISKKFYCEVLGLKVLYEDAAHVFLKVGEADQFGILALLIYPLEGPAPVDPKERQGNKYNHFGFRAKSDAEVFDFAEHLRGSGVKIIKGPYTRKDGSSVYFLDPDGYTLEYLYLKEDPEAYV
jgi:catechol 2,3-dioxygenase-like lactoylglutathione lyase family enzyme